MIGGRLWCFSDVSFVGGVGWSFQFWAGLGWTGMGRGKLDGWSWHAWEHGSDSTRYPKRDGLSRIVTHAFFLLLFAISCQVDVMT